MDYHALQRPNSNHSVRVVNTFRGDIARFVFTRHGAEGPRGGKPGQAASISRFNAWSMPSAVCSRLW
jgi:hypothetical protein